jgi:hypothetical protein
VSSADQDGSDAWPCSGRAQIVATGNWYIDAGIVGFLRILNSLWNSDHSGKWKLKDVVEGKVPCERLFFDFSFAFWYSRAAKAEDEAEDKEVKNVLHEFKNGIIEKWKEAASRNDYRSEIVINSLTSVINEHQKRLSELRPGGSEKNGDKAPVLFSKSIFLHNFEFDNPNKMKNPAKRIELFVKYLRSGGMDENLDRALVKLLPSVKESGNEFLKVLTVHDLVEKVHPLSHAFLLSFEEGLAQAPYYSNNYLFFHSLDLYDSYEAQEYLSAIASSENEDTKNDMKSQEWEKMREAFKSGIVVVEIGKPGNDQRVQIVRYLPLDECAAGILGSSDSMKYFLYTMRLPRRFYVRGLEGLSRLAPLSTYALAGLYERLKSAKKGEDAGGFYIKALLGWAAADLVRIELEGRSGAFKGAEESQEDLGVRCSNSFNRNHNLVKHAYESAKSIFTKVDDRDLLIARTLQLVEDLLKGDTGEFMGNLLRMLASTRQYLEGDALKRYTWLLGYIARQMLEAVDSETPAERSLHPKALPIMLGAWATLSRSTAQD